MDCKKCNNNRYTLGNCCSGHMCGCIGLPATSINCPDCNPNADIKPNLKDEWFAYYFENVEYIGV